MNAKLAGARSLVNGGAVRSTLSAAAVAGDGSAVASRTSAGGKSSLPAPPVSGAKPVIPRIPSVELSLTELTRVPSVPPAPPSSKRPRAPSLRRRTQPVVFPMSVTATPADLSSPRRRQAPAIEVSEPETADTALDAAEQAETELESGVVDKTPPRRTASTVPMGPAGRRRRLMTTPECPATKRRAAELMAAAARANQLQLEPLPSRPVRRQVQRRVVDSALRKRRTRPAVNFREVLRAVEAAEDSDVDSNVRARNDSE